MQPRLDRANVDPERDRDLGVGQAIEVKQRDRRSLAARQRVDRAPHAVGELALFDLRQRRRLRVERLADCLTADSRLQRPRFLASQPKPRAAHLQADAAQPCPEAFRFSQAVQVEQRDNDGLMRSVVGPGGIAENAATGRDEQWLVPLDKRAKCLAVPFPRGLDQLRVRGLESLHPWSYPD